MATFTAGPAQTGVQPKGLRVGLSGVKASISFDGFSSSIATIGRMIPIPAHSKVMEMEFWANVSGEYTLEVGDSVNSQRYRSSTTYSTGVGNVIPTVQQKAYSYSADDMIIMRLSLVSVVTLGGAFHMNVIFSMDA